MAILTREQILTAEMSESEATLWRVLDAVKNGRLPDQRTIDEFSMLFDAIQSAGKTNVGLRSVLGFTGKRRGRKGPTGNEMDRRAGVALEVIALMRIKKEKRDNAIEQVALRNNISERTARRYYDSQLKFSEEFLLIMRKPARESYLKLLAEK